MPSPPPFQIPTRAVRELTHEELVWTLRQPGLAVVEWATYRLTFVVSRPLLRIVRTGAFGGDVRDVHGGWQYGNSIALLMDWQEIRLVGDVVRGWQN